MEGDEDSFCVLRLLESSHGCEPRVEVTDVGFQPVCGVGDAWIDEMFESVAAGLLEAQEDVVVDGTQTEDVCFDDSFQVFPAQEKSLRRGIQKEFAVAVEDTFLCVAGMPAESLELQPALDVPEQMDVAALHVDAVALQHLCEPR